MAATLMGVYSYTINSHSPYHLSLCAERVITLYTYSRDILTHPSTHLPLYIRHHRFMQTESVLLCKSKEAISSVAILICRVNGDEGLHVPSPSRSFTVPRLCACCNTCGGSDSNIYPLASTQLIEHPPGKATQRIHSVHIWHWCAPHTRGNDSADTIYLYTHR